VPNYDPGRIAHLEDRLAVGTRREASASLSDLELLADLYIQADSYVPALETIERLLSLPGARALSVARRAALESKAVACRLGQGDCQAALAHCRDLLRDEAKIESIPIRARIHLQCADALFGLSRFADCREHAERVLRMADEGGDLSLSAAALNQLGRTAYREGELQRARDLYEQALVLYRRLGEEACAARVRNNLGLIHKNLCEWESAVAHLSGALESFRHLGRFADTGPVLLNLGIVHQKSGDWPRADECYRGAEEVFLQVSDHLHLSRVAIGRGNIARLQRRFVDAEGVLLGALERARSHDNRREEVLALEFLGELDMDRGRPENALARYHDALALAERVAPEGDAVVEIERRRAEVLCVMQRFDDAEQACERARLLARRIQDRLEQAITHRVSGEISWGRGRRDEAVQRWKVAVTLLTDCRERLELGRTHMRLAGATEDPLEARRHFYRAVSLFADLPTPYWLELAEAGLQRLVGGAVEPAPVRPASLLGRRHRAPSLVACSRAMQVVESVARRAAGTDLSVLLTGETGTGKELIARTIHGLSPRASRPFLAVNCGALRPDLALSQLFGHRKGAFTGAHAEGVGLVEAAHGGALFLDEVGELPHDVQVTLLRFLESGEYLRLGETQVRRADVRVISATNRELRSADGERSFRRDLLFRLNEIEIRLPSLRERRDDILPLARHFLAFYGGLEGPQLAADSDGVLLAHAWPGNVRELENVMKRVAALSAAGERTVPAVDLLPFLSQEAPAPAAPVAAVAPDERAAILSAYQRSGGNKSRLAEMLGVSRKTLYARIKRLGITLH
jgi:DNA-binding NtrC family response regulator/tetratricopeptide (TPR) repeat protein